jgi:hypothetical protein
VEYDCDVLAWGKPGLFLCRCKQTAPSVGQSNVENGKRQFAYYELIIVNIVSGALKTRNAACLHCQPEWNVLSIVVVSKWL